MAEGGVKVIYKNKKDAGHPFHGGSWKVALADPMNVPIEDPKFLKELSSAYHHCHTTTLIHI